MNFSNSATKLVAKYVTSRVNVGREWRNLYDFAEACLKEGYDAGRKDERIRWKRALKPHLPGPRMRK